MDNFSNNEVLIDNVPQFEKVQLLAIHSNYYKIILINIGIVFLLLGVGLGIFSYFEVDFFPNRVWLLLGAGYFIALALFTLFYRISFTCRGYAFREHDAIYKEGVISQTTTIVPYKRVQHVALHQGLFSRYFGLASLELFTAGGSATDLEISGLTLEDAQRYKHWIVQKIDSLVEETEEELIITDDANTKLNDEA